MPPRKPGVSAWQNPTRRRKACHGIKIDAVKLVCARAKEQITAMAKRKTLHPSLDIRTETAADVRLCEWPGCTDGGEHKAPKSREMLREYRWFCLEHVRVYNKRWNYFDGMSDEEVEASLRHDTVWNRPTWPLGDSEEREQVRPKPGHGPFGIDSEYFKDAFGFFEDEPGNDTGPRADAPTRAALAVFGLELPVTPVDLKARYKVLVKQHHPDANGGNKAAEEKFKEIREAYETLCRFLVI